MATSDPNSDAYYAASQPASQKSLAELGEELAYRVSALVHHEIELAKAEMTEKGKRAGFGAGMFGAAGLLAAFAFGCITRVLWPP
jgi:hypothetical protein